MADGGCQLEQMDGLIDGDIWTEEKNSSYPVLSLPSLYSSSSVEKLIRKE